MSFWGNLFQQKYIGKQWGIIALSAGQLAIFVGISNLMLNSVSAFDNIDVSSINGTFSVDRSGCAWASNIPNVGITADAWKINESIGDFDCGDRAVQNLEDTILSISVKIVSNKVQVHAIAYNTPWSLITRIDVFIGETPLLSGNNQCLDTLAMSNSLIDPCTPPDDGSTWPIGESGMASVNWKP